MIKAVPIDRVRPGMWFHRLGGSGYHHAFVKNGFLLEARDIELLAQGGIEELLIDTAKGLDVEEETAVAPEPVSPAPDEPAPPPEPAPAAVASPPGAAPPPAAPLEPRTSMDLEMQRARQIREEARAQVVALFNDARLGKAIQPEAVMPLVEQVNDSVARHPDALLSVLRLKTHDEYTYLHSVAVCALMVALGRRLGLPEAQVRDAGTAGMLHDIGKAVMPLSVLNKPGALTDEEFRIMKSHPERGFEMLKQAGTGSEAVLDVALHHHEKFDGTGYPHRLQGEDIALMARMGAVCDVYDAITSNRPYKRAWGPAESLQRMISWKGHFDERVLKAFIRSVGIYPVGALVRLESDRLAVVLEQGEGSLLTPRVRVFFNARKREPVFIKDLDLSAPNCGDRIVGLESVEKWNFPNLDRLWQAQ
ncbi:MAG: phosphodiesterase [Silanimonas sp.]|nr:MAG: phosphodiesterase [Silanimonas sp.]